ncbi:hypothetical protein OHB24_20815 [Kribbella sp. NBC_00482]|uniref:hypothetical protein n=1 Tax=Kribbella sp. NBC_00482 TaxID=2975968 RepID=UPI002E18401A
MSVEAAHPVAALNWRLLRPYVSVVVMECTADDPRQLFDGCERVLRDPWRSRPGREERIVARSSPEAEAPRSLENLGIDQIAGFVREVRAHPGWAAPGSSFVDATNHVTVLLRRGRLLAVHTDSVTVDRLQRWLDKAPRPALRRIPPEVLESALLTGESKGLWLRGTHQRRTTKPDTKNISGQRLQDALSPFEDSSFAMGSAKALLDDDPERFVLHGTIGTTPRRSSVWFGPATDFTDFAGAVAELLLLLDKALVSGTATGHGLPHLARPVADLSGVFGAYEIIATAPDELANLPDLGDEVRAAATTLEAAMLDVQEKANSPDFLLGVGFGGSISGTLALGPRAEDHGFDLSLGYAAEPTDPPPVREIMDALEHQELLTVYYRSGHTFSNGQIWKERIPVAAFRNWRFEDFTGFDITREKPDRTEPHEIHDLAGRPGDTSLFGWVVRHFSDGWLTCDDGAGEAADFFHIAPDDGCLSAIHVKAARTASPRRRIAAAAYEVVIGQAVKNLVYADTDRLRVKLSRAPVARPACWTDGANVDDRADFLEALEMRNATDPWRVVVVQPHIAEPTYQQLRFGSNGAETNLLRLHLVETLLNSARASVVGIGGELEVIGST